MNTANEISERPWGKYHKFHQEPGVWVKRVEVNPNARLSLQKHQHRSEKWIVVAGSGTATVNELEIQVFPGSVVDVPLGSVHRIANTGQDLLVFIEVACGEILTGDDITRIEDDYARHKVEFLKNYKRTDFRLKENFPIIWSYEGPTFEKIYGDGIVLNISLSGMQIITNGLRRPPDDRVILIETILGEKLPLGPKKARVSWVEHAHKDNRDCFKCGLKFIEDLNADQKFKDWIDKKINELFQTGDIKTLKDYLD